MNVRHPLFTRRATVAAVQVLVAMLAAASAARGADFADPAVADVALPRSWSAGRA